jgi:hypothetical protein
VVGANIVAHSRSLYTEGEKEAEEEKEVVVVGGKGCDARM